MRALPRRSLGEGGDFTRDDRDFYGVPGTDDGQGIDGIDSEMKGPIASIMAILTRCSEPQGWNQPFYPGNNSNGFFPGFFLPSLARALAKAGD